MAFNFHYPYGSRSPYYRVPRDGLRSNSPKESWHKTLSYEINQKPRNLVRATSNQKRERHF